MQVFVAKPAPTGIKRAGFVQILSVMCKFLSLNPPLQEFTVNDDDTTEEISVRNSVLTTLTITAPSHMYRVIPSFFNFDAELQESSDSLALLPSN